ncbi:hypothetical protein H310_00806 [Aphanomyces invadans]|uniref:U1 small nuclear ribonucleoprotein C n=1 Tax=Aphanomyces invadans TaxID=157072 RepID=A0A024UX52_9STRA|nr:hypothetical protein H310_00806 [Aphanomyces invadans]ETW10522.1 hypothetical protein H310_00806 [Aphanomyces invadans]|eukprot:XP_008861933.1 hypothetical protein H310_00806 [Aphanomyces invadans]
MPRYYCDYCDTYLTHDSQAGRKQHNRGWKHRENVKLYYEAVIQGQGATMTPGAWLRPDASRPPAPRPPLMMSMRPPMAMGMNPMGIGMQPPPMMMGMRPPPPMGGMFPPPRGPPPGIVPMMMRPPPVT